MAIIPALEMEVERLGVQGHLVHSDLRSAFIMCWKIFEQNLISYKYICVYMYMCVYVYIYICLYVWCVS